MRVMTGRVVDGKIDIEGALEDGTSVAVLRVLNDGISNTVKKGKKVRIA